MFYSVTLTMGEDICHISAHLCCRVCTIQHICQLWCQLVTIPDDIDHNMRKSTVNIDFYVLFGHTNNGRRHLPHQCSFVLSSMYDTTHMPAVVSTGHNSR